MDRLYSLRHRFTGIPEVDPMAGPTFPNTPPPPSRVETWEEFAARRASLEGVPTLSQGEQLATALTGTKTLTEETTKQNAEQNPYAFWKAPIGANKEGKGGIPLDLAVTLAGTLASSIAPKEWSGKFGAGLAQMAQQGGLAHEQWIKEQKEAKLEEKKFGLEKEKIGVEREKVAIEKARKTEVQILAEGGPEAETLIKNKETMARQEALASETPAMKAVHTAQADMYTAASEASRVSAEKDREVLKYTPDEQRRAQLESTANINRLNAAAKESSAHADYFTSEAKRSKEEGKAENLLLKGSIDAYRTAQSAWISAYAKSLTPEEKTQNMSILTATTERYISSMGTFKKPELGNDALSFWLSSANDELSSALEPSTGKLLTQGKGFLGLGGTIVEPRRDMLFQQRASQIVSFMQSMGSSIDDASAYKSLDLFTRIYSQTTHTRQMNTYATLMVEVGKALGYPMTTLQSLITPPASELRSGQTGGGVTETEVPMP